MWPFKFKQKEETVESLMQDCNKLYSSFNSYLTIANTPGYYEFKMVMKKNFTILQTALGKSEDEETTKCLLKHFKSQLKFFEKNPFLCSSEDFHDFIKVNCPYDKKVQAIIQNKSQAKSKVSM